MVIKSRVQLIYLQGEVKVDKLELMNSDLKNKTPDELTRLVCSLGGKKYAAGYIFSFIHGKCAESIDDITPLSKSLRQKLSKEGYYISSLTKVQCLEEANTAKKYLFELNDKCLVELVVLFDGVRKTVCVSCQVGCRMATKLKKMSFAAQWASAKRL